MTIADFIGIASLLVGAGGIAAHRLAIGWCERVRDRFAAAPPGSL
jgi:hypothetical protein